MKIWLAFLQLFLLCMSIASLEEKSVSRTEIKEVVFYTSTEDKKSATSYEISPIEDQIQKHKKTLALRHLNSLFGSLSHHCSWSSFNYDTFESDSYNLESRLSNIASFVKKLNNPNLLNRVNYAHIMFHDMKTAVLLNKIYPPNQCQDHLMLRNMVVLNVSLYMLRSSEGVPDMSNSDYLILVRTFQQNLESWVALFGKSGEVPGALRLVFNRQVSQARHTFDEFLKVHLCKEKC